MHERATNAVPRVLIAGMGNVLCADDGFGVAVANALMPHALASEVDVIEVGIGGMHVVQALMDGYDALIIVDAIDRGAQPGTLFVLEPHLALSEDTTVSIADLHLAVPARVLAVARGLGVLPPRVLLVGAQTATVELGLHMSEPVQRAVAGAVRQIVQIVQALVTDPAVAASAERSRAGAVT
jgi:hydrogenase maturation protease